MLESLKIIIEETFEIFNLATLNGKLFIPFFIGCVWLLLSDSEEDARARRYLVYPSLILFLFLFNPVFIHLMYKFIGVNERIVRIFWPLPMDIVCVYCIVRLVGMVKARWKKAAALLAAVMLFVLSSGGTLAGVSFGLAENSYKLPKGTKQVSDVIYELNMRQDSNVILPVDLFFWIREYNSSIRMPYVRDMEQMYDEEGVMDLDTVGKLGVEGSCGFVVLNDSEPTKGELESYGYEKVLSIEGDDCHYLVYQLKEAEQS